MLTAPLDMTIRGSNVQFARPLFNLTGTRVVGSEWEAELSTLRVSYI